MDKIGSDYSKDCLGNQFLEEVKEELFLFLFPNFASNFKNR